MCARFRFMTAENTERDIKKICIDENNSKNLQKDFLQYKTCKKRWDYARNKFFEYKRESKSLHLNLTAKS